MPRIKLNGKGVVTLDAQLADKASFARIAELLTRDDASTPASLVTGDESIQLTAGSAAFLAVAAKMLADGKQVTVATTEAELSTFEAAKLLGVSRQYLVQLCDGGKLPFRREGTHRRLALDDVLEYRTQRNEERMRKHGEMVRAAVDAGEYDLDITVEEASF